MFIIYEKISAAKIENDTGKRGICQEDTLRNSCGRKDILFPQNASGKWRKAKAGFTSTTLCTSAGFSVYQSMIFWSWQIQKTTPNKKGAFAPFFIHLYILFLTANYNFFVFCFFHFFQILRLLFRRNRHKIYIKRLTIRRLIILRLMVKRLNSDKRRKHDGYQKKLSCRS